MFETIVNKQQMIHMAAEIVILLGVIIYFNQKNRKLANQIEDLIQRVEEQEDIIQKHEQLIQQISTYMISINKSTYIPKPVINASTRKQPEVVFATQSAPVARSPTSVPPVLAPVLAPAPVVNKVLTPILENEIDLDSEIQDELNELEVLDNEEAQKNAP